MIDLVNETGQNIDISRLEEIANKLTDRDIELVLCDDDSIKELNYEYRGVNAPTDVLSFPLTAGIDGVPLGSIIISMDKVKEKAKELGHSQEDELSLLFIHGLLHLLGYDHELDDGEMREKEREIIEQFNLPKSLIVRTEGI